MKIILRQNVERLGQRGDIVTVKDGFARNYLIPRKLALVATPGNLRAFQEEKKQLDVRENKDRRLAEQLAKKLKSVSITATVAVGEEDRVFGSVTAQTISGLLKEKGYEIDKKKILLEEPIKALGVYTVPLKLHHDVEGKVKVWVVKE
ncbi:MAG: 50S ribosomal protein L9 [candidate division Zixibacteria bacterium SM23_81]|nr:MAG: 50S ribosomal protein L9 [candidate division Zixibacteria bacterium SM23_81]